MMLSFSSEEWNCTVFVFGGLAYFIANEVILLACGGTSFRDWTETVLVAQGCLQIALFAVFTGCSDAL